MPPSPAPVYVALINDYEIVTAGIATVLKPFQHRVRVEQYVNAIPPRGRADVVLYDPFAHPGPDDRLHELVADTGSRVLVYAWPQSHQQIDAAIRRGAAGFLSKTATAEEIIAAIEAVCDGKTVSSPPAPEQSPMVTWVGQDQGLSPREAEIIGLIAAGLSNEQIARRSYLSINSVKTYIRTAYRKIGVTSRTQAVLWAVDHGFIGDRTN